MKKKRFTLWTPFFLLLAAAAAVFTPMIGLITLFVAGIFVILAIIFAIRRYPTDRKKRRIEYLLILVVLFLAVALFGILRYQPALIAAPGYSLQNVTDPGWLNGRIKSVQAGIEQVPCTYTLLGWQGEEHLYYQATCGSSDQMWHYVVSTERSEKTNMLPDDLYAVSVPVSTIEDGLLANVHPRELATVSRQTFIAGEPLSSPNGRYTALVSRHVYGPQDVLLLSSIL